MVTVGRWFLQRLATYYERTGRLSQIVLAWIYMGVVASALITELIGIHLIFGAFLLGAVMPKNEGLVRDLAQKTEDFVLIFLLPIFLPTVACGRKLACSTGLNYGYFVQRSWEWQSLASILGLI